MDKKYIFNLVFIDPPAEPFELNQARVLTFQTDTPGKENEQRVKDAVREFLSTNYGLDYLELHNGCFRWGDCSVVPKDIWEKHGLVPVALLYRRGRDYCTTHLLAKGMFNLDRKYIFNLVVIDPSAEFSEYDQARVLSFQTDVLGEENEQRVRNAVAGYLSSEEGKEYMTSNCNSFCWSDVIMVPRSVWERNGLTPVNPCQKTFAVDASEILAEV